MATTSQVTDIKTTEKSHNSLWGKRGGRKEQVSCPLKGPKAWKVAVTHETTFHNILALIR